MTIARASGIAAPEALGQSVGARPGGGRPGEDGPMDSATDDVSQAIAGELLLMDPDVRASRERAGRLLDPEFVEVAGSGRR